MIRSAVGRVVPYPSHGLEGYEPSQTDPPFVPDLSNPGIVSCRLEFRCAFPNHNLGSRPGRLAFRSPQRVLSRLTNALR